MFERRVGAFFSQPKASVFGASFWFFLLSWAVKGRRRKQRRYCEGFEERTPKMIVQTEFDRAMNEVHKIGGFRWRVYKVLDK